LTAQHIKIEGRVEIVNKKIFIHNFPIKLTEGHHISFTSPLFLGNQEWKLKRMGVGEPGVSIVKKILAIDGVKKLSIYYHNYLEIETEGNTKTIANAIKLLVSSL